jgi:4-hydroxy-3-methylbut-2-en-1-yl diphosphate reductase
MTTNSPKPPLKVLLCSPRGFCAGVVRAIDTVERALAMYGKPVYVRHEIVHNRYVVDGLRQKGAVFVEELDEIPDTNAPVVFSAHGVPKSVPEQASRRNFIAIDATCPLVTKVHREAEIHFRRGREIILIGHAGHPEVTGTMGQLPPGAVRLVQTADEAAAFVPANPDKLAYVTQTTLSVDDTACIVEALRTRFPGLKAPVKEDICYATQNRQDAVKDLIGHCDVLVVVGSKSSSNSNRLREMADKVGIPGFLVDGPEFLHKEWFDGAKTVGVTAGASAPEILVQGVITQLKEWGGSVVNELKGREEHVIFALPRTLRDVTKRVGSLSSDGSAG